MSIGKIEEVKDKDNYRTDPKKYRASICASVGSFLLEHRGYVYTDKELVEEMHSIGFKVSRTSQIENAVRLYNKDQFRRSRIHITEKIQSGWWKGENGEPNVRFFYIE